MGGITRVLECKLLTVLHHICESISFLYRDTLQVRVNFKIKKYTNKIFILESDEKCKM